MTTIQDIYKKIPSVNCKRKCQEACGPIAMSEAEQAYLKHLYPDVDLAHDKVIERYKSGCTSCVALKKGGGSIYKDRPAICRLFGVVKKMRCPHGCSPKRWLSDNEARSILRSLDAIHSPFSVS